MTNRAGQPIRGTSPELRKAARDLRDTMTRAEHDLWDAIRNRKLQGLRFRTQHPGGQFILDFYCPARKLVIEIDGEIHKTRTEQDAARTAHLESFGYHVIRFTNEEIFGELDSVLSRIIDAANRKTD